MENEHTFEYDPKNKKLLFSNKKDYEWAKRFFGSLSLSLHLNGYVMKSFNPLCSDQGCLLILKDLNTQDESVIIDLLKANGLEMKTSTQQIRKLRR